MQAIILAAGKGSRMGKLTENKAKPMLSFEGEPIIKWSIKNLYAAGIRKVIIAIGHRGNDIIDLIGRSFEDMEIEYVVNEQFESTNNIYTLWRCKDYLAERDSLIVEGDLLFDKEIVKKIIASERENVIGVSPLCNWMNGTVIEKAKNGKLKVGNAKKTSPLSTPMKTINICKFSKGFSQRVYLPLIERKIERKEFKLYYEDVISSQILNRHFGLYKVDEQEKWIEVDNPLDLWHASLKFSKSRLQYNAILSSYGGLWRVPELLDYFYLTNPFFPTGELVKELKETLESLVVNYPSGREIVNSLASVMFGCDTNSVVVSNGASEAIEFLLKTIKCKFGVFAPSFDEYLNRLCSENLIVRELEPPNFQIEFSDLLLMVESVDCIILVNPNNPTGGILHQGALIELLDILKQKKKFLIIDESFADFCSEDISLLDQKILARYENLFIIKSLGKSYGIPGLRLGLIFSSNTIINEEVKKTLPIWNINSIAEHFFEIFPRYQREFRDSCRRLQEERDFLIHSISNLDNIRAIPSHGNFILCELTGYQSADDVSFTLFKDYNILVKDCSKKAGVKNQQYIRLAVKGHKENLLVLNALKEIL